MISPKKLLRSFLIRMEPILVMYSKFIEEIGEIRESRGFLA